MKILVYAGALALLAATAACSNWGSRPMGPTVPFDSGLRPNVQTGSTCSPADATCGTGIGNPSVQSPVQKRELNASPQ
ncbi:MAG TPA: hypothetical protein VGL83_17360 [Stellaceae bacterium]|jgi:hypothetical protein